MSSDRVLVTGGAGYIGSHLVDRLVSDGYEVVVLDALVAQVHPSGDWPAYANPGAEYVRGDVRDRTVLEPHVTSAHAVVHFAAAVSVGQSMYEIDRYVDVNTRATGLLLDILVNQKHSVKKLLVASSVGVYGEGAYECAECGPLAPGLRSVEQLADKRWEPECSSCGVPLRPVPTPEDKSLHRDSIYSQTKYHQEEMALLIGKTYGIPTVTPRFFNVYGPRQSISNPYAGVAAIFLSRLLNGNRPLVFEDGGQLRDFVSVHDVVDGLMAMIETPGADYLPVNLGSGTQIAIGELATLLAGLLDVDIELQMTEQGRKFDIRHCFADISRARETLGFEPKVSLAAGMAELIAWGRDNSDQAIDKVDDAMAELRAKNLFA